MPSTASFTQHKLCSKCGRDITHERRLKDAQGHYWCTDCGVPGDLASTSSGLISPCPKCHAPTHATQMIRKDGIYVCIACANGVKRKKSGVHAATHGHDDHGHGSAAAVVHAGLSDEERRKRKMIVLAIALMGLGAFLYFYLNG